MTSVNETNGSSQSKLNDGDILHLNSEYTESAKDMKHTETELLDNSFISVGEKSELDIELEMCEELLEKEVNENTEVVCIDNFLEVPSENNVVACSNNSHESLSENTEVLCINNSLESPYENSSVIFMNGSCELPSENNEVACINNSHELPAEHNEILCVNNSHELLSEKNEVACINNSHELPSEYNEILYLNNSHELPSENNEVACINNTHELLSVLEEDGFDLEIKKCCDILKLEEPTDPHVSSLLCKSDVEASLEGELKVNGDNPIEKVTSDIKCEIGNNEPPLLVEADISTLEEFEISILETDVSTLEEFEISILECANSPIVTEEKPFVSQVDAVEDKKMIYSVVHVPEKNDLDNKRPVEDKKMIYSVVHVPETNYLDNEANDINDPRWELIRNLATDEERYEQVRKCWKIKTVPDPNKNLTYHSYRKRHFRNRKVMPKTRKRAATSNLDVSELHPAKRQRSCTYTFDQNINALSEEKTKKEQDLLNKMYSEIRQLNHILFQQELRLQRHNDYATYNPIANQQLYFLRGKCQREIQRIQQQYTSKAGECATELQLGIQALNQARDEVLQFSNFYKGLNSNDPTVLTTFELQELEDIENIYSRFAKLYE